MATDQLEVLNNALTHLGEKRVLNATETKGVRDLIASFDIVRKRLLRRFPFPFARTRAQMTTVAATGVHLEEFDYVHTKPTNWLRTLELSHDGDFEHGRILDYSDEGGMIYSDHDTAYIWYVIDHTVYTEWDPIFDDLMALELAEHCCLQITDSKSLNDLKQDDLRRLRATARAIASSDLEVQQRPMGKFRASRFGDTQNRNYSQF